MADRDDSVLDKAEHLARRLLESLGAKVDSKLGSPDDQTLSPREVGDITSRLERAVESSLKRDARGVNRVAPNRFKVLLTYERHSGLNSKYVEALEKELKTTVFEYINNRRYETEGPVEVEIASDLFTKVIAIRASFESESAAAAAPPEKGAVLKSASRPQGSRRLELHCEDGRVFCLDLKVNGAPAYLGRVAGNAVRIDDNSLSRHHCSIALRSNGDVVVSDLGSSNGTMVNDHNLSLNEARPLAEGDVILAGDVALTVSKIS